MDFSESRVDAIGRGGPVGASNYLRLARAGDMAALADFIAWSLYKALVDRGLNHKEAVNGAWLMIQTVDIKLKAING